jgi:hypothetical protein
MTTRSMAAVLLILAGAAGLLYGGFSYTQASHRADLGPIHFSLDTERHVNVPVWAGVAAIVLGGLLLLGGRVGARR